MAKSIIIIGAGIGGMAAGIYGQINGFQTRIFEMHHLPGGQCANMMASSLPPQKHRSPNAVHLCRTCRNINLKKFLFQAGIFYIHVEYYYVSMCIQVTFGRDGYEKNRQRFAEIHSA